MGADSELWPPRCFSQHASLVHRSPGLLLSFPGEAARSLPSVGTQSYVGPRILPALPMPQSHFLKQSFSNGVPPTSMKAPQGSYFPADSPSSGVTVTGPPGHHVPSNLLLLRGRSSLKSHFPAHGDDGTWRCPGRAPSGGLAWCGQL